MFQFLLADILATHQKSRSCGSRGNPSFDIHRVRWLSAWVAPLRAAQVADIWQLIRNPAAVLWKQGNPSFDIGQLLFVLEPPRYPSGFCLEEVTNHCLSVFMVSTRLAETLKL